MSPMDSMLLSGDEAVALAAFDAGIGLGRGYPGTPSTEILEAFSALGGNAQWSPNEKVAMEVGLGAAFGAGRVLVTMKHVGLNVAADPLFTAAYTGVSGALVVVVADDPGMSSSQNEQDSRRYAVAAALPMIEPSDSQEAYDFFFAAVEMSEKWHIPVILRMTTRVCHSKTLISRRGPHGKASAPRFERDIKGRVMIPAYARPAHRRLRQKLAEIAQWAEGCALNQRVVGEKSLGIIANGITVMHAMEAAPGASFLKLGTVHPLPMKLIRGFAQSVERCLVIEEGDPYLVESIRAAGIAVDGKAEMYRFGELSVERVARIINRDESPEPVPPRGKPPQLCPGCPYRTVFEIFRKLDLIVSGDIGCYTLGVLPPFEAMDTCVCMGASLGVGLGLRHVLPENEARRVVSVIGDSTFVHSGISGLVEMIYNPPKTGHVLVILDNGTTAMTGQQEHPGTGRTLNHDPTGKVRLEDLARSLGVKNVDVIDPTPDPDAFEKLMKERLASNDLTVLIARRPCLLAAGKIKEYEKAAAEKCGGCQHAESCDSASAG
jgi:indolepyruvate ferredoxin oxidoreductase alpha subunit